MRMFTHRQDRAVRAGVLSLLAAALVLAAAACGGSSGSPDAQHTALGGIPTNTPTPTVTPQVVPSVSAGKILEAAQAGDLKSFVSAVAAAGLDKALGQGIPYTVLVPTDQAFKDMGLAELLKSVPKAKTVLGYHIIPAEDLRIGKIKDGQEMATYLGYPVRFNVKDGAVMVNDANVVKVIEGKDWSIFVIDKVLDPPLFATPEASVPPSEAPAP
jgi:uncharacterized surface protein with fasciclin (FAS1) repeats